jgi:hypothetical protein
MILDHESTERIRHAAWLTARDYTLPKIASQFLADFAALTAQSPYPARTVIPHSRAESTDPHESP